MSWQKLVNFRTIFDRKDFNFISEARNINGVAKIMLWKVANLDGNEPEYRDILKDFLNNLASFCTWMQGRGWIAGKTNPDFDEGYIAAVGALERSVNLFKEQDERRKSISRKYLQKFAGSFLGGLSGIYKGIKIAFDPDILGLTSITDAQIVNYFLDSVEGLQKTFAFNSIGTYAAERKIKLLNKLELIVTERLLLRPGAQVRTLKGWIDLGSRGTLVRVLREPGTNRIFYIYKVTEHADYEHQLSIPPTACYFKAA